MKLLSSFSALLLCVVYAFIFSRQRKKVHRSATGIRDLLRPANMTMESLLRARAMPNQRLVKAFGITSTFVSADPETHRNFVGKAKDLIAGLSAKGERWNGLSQATEKAVSRLLPESDIDYDTFMQCITLTVVLFALFLVAPESPQPDDLIFATHTINKRWTDSKTKPGALEEDNSLACLVALLEQWIGHTDQTGDLSLVENPLNLILPAYETMWRVVAVTVAHVYCHDDDSLHDVVLQFAEKPTDEQYRLPLSRSNDEKQKVSMKHIVMEALRLHPPTKHIARASTVSWWRRALLFSPELEIADVKSVHLSAAYGADPRRFDPMRFHPSRVCGEGKQELYAFGYGRLSCPAAMWAPMGAALIAAKVIEQMDAMGYKLTVGPRIGDRSGWDGWVVRVAERI